MNAGPQSIVSLLTSANQRMVIPVYQRAYSWDAEQCRQLWDDIVAAGRRSSGNHFTGSVVMVLGGEFSAAGVNKILVIDGQQRITTLSLLIVAIAEFAREHPDKLTHVSYEEIVDSGYLVLKHKKGEDHYRLTLSEGDEKTLRSVLDHLENQDIEAVGESHRIVDNLALFRTWLNNIEDPNVVWDGIQRLEIVAITLAQGQDNPQLIFESMNSTGKDLSTADLVRNFVLMGLPMDEQEDLYANYWRKIEETLGADSYDEVFDEFLRNWLTVIYAPTSINMRDVYRLFKRHVSDNGYDKSGQMAVLLKEIRRYAGCYAQITMGAANDKDLRMRLARIKALDVTVVNPLLMSFLDDCDEGSFGRDDLLEMLDVTESYLLRRSVCDIATNSLNKFFSSVIARLNASQEEGCNYLEAYEAILLGEAGTARRMPTDADFERALRTRDCYAFRRGFFLLSALENSYHPKDPRDYAGGTYTIEHIMPRNALAREDWRKMLGPECERVHDELVNALGNLTLTAYNSELSDASFAQKKARTVGGYDKELLVISKSLQDTDVWNEETIRARTDALTKRALEIWRMPHLDGSVIDSYRPAKKAASPAMRKITFRMICASGYLKAGDALVSFEDRHEVTAKITDDYAIRLSNGEEVDSPSRAAIRVKELETGKHYAINGWQYWRVGADGPCLAELKAAYLSEAERADELDAASLRAAFWDGFFDCCSEREDFVRVYGDQSERWDNRGWSVSFGLGIHGASVLAYYSRRGWVAASIWMSDLALYDSLLARRSEVDEALSSLGGKIAWNEGNEKSRELLVRLDTDVTPEHWDELYTWLVDGLLKIRPVAKMLEAE